MATVFARSRFWNRHAGEAFNDRQRRILTQLLNGFEGKLTSSKWAKLAKCSHDTALRDIEDLVHKGVLKKDAAGGRSTSYSLLDAG
jgi:Fic family protein